MDLSGQILQSKKNFRSELAACENEGNLKELQTKYLGRKSGEITRFFQELSTLPAEQRPHLGKQINELKNYVTEQIDILLNRIRLTGKGSTQFDFTLPGRPQFIGRLHPLTLVMQEIISIFEGMGFAVETGPEIETDYYNFEALNIPKDHPARDLQDTFYLDDDRVLRTHTSPVQIRVMERQKPPIRIIAPGRVFRKDTPDATHSPIFYQIEGLYVDKHVTLAELKGTLLAFARSMFGPEINVRFRSGFFPFTEPSVEYDFTCVMCRGKGCSICKGTGWIEISGAGMVDPQVFRYVDYDPEIYTGYAWGMGVERIAMLKYRISDIRLFYENDYRFIQQFS